MGARHGRHHHGQRGSQAHPFSTAQKLVSALRPGQTGCLEPGTYDLHGQLKFSRSGRASAPIVLEGDPGRQAILIDGYVEIPHGSDYVSVDGLRIDSRHSSQTGVQILGAHDSLAHSTVTNGNTHNSCIIIGSDTGYGRATHTLLEGNIVHSCGYDPRDPFEDHGVYVDNSLDATIQNNVFWGVPYGWGVQLYPHSVGTQVVHNVIVDNRQGVVFGGNDIFTSSNNLVAYNVISGSGYGYDVQSYWGGTVGRGNVAAHNCLFNRHAPEIQRPTKGFVATANLIADPRYVNPAGHNYTLQSTSPCRRVVG